MTDAKRSLTLPNVRSSILLALRFLSQGKGGAASAIDWFDLAINVLYDEPGMADKAQELVGASLHGLDESTKVQAVLQSLDHAFAQHGMVEGGEVVKLPEWPAIAAEAQEAYALFSENDRKHAATPPASAAP